MADLVNDGKPKFLRSFVDCLDSWYHQKIPNCRKFTLSLQPNAALVRIPYDVTRIWLSSFCMNNISLLWQWDCKVIQRRGGWDRWVMGASQYLTRPTSEKILNIMSLVKGWFGINQSVKTPNYSRESENSLLLDAVSFLGDIDSITQNETSTNVSDHVAGYILCHKGTETVWRTLWSTTLVWWTK